MSDASHLTDTIRNQTLELIKQSQQATVQAAETWTGLVTGSVPESVDVSAYAKHLPDPTTVTEQVFDFTEQLLATQREFVTGLAGAFSPVAEATQRHVQEAATTATKNTQSTKSSKSN